MKRIAIIGAGAAGLAAAKNLISNDQSIKYEICVFEQSDQVGGTWVYTNQIGYDSFGLPVHSSMYKSLRTNLPKEVMGYPDFPISTNDLKSYISAEDILKFLQTYAQHFGLYQYIKFRHHVKNVKPMLNAEGETCWQLQVIDLIGDKIITSDFDAVMVCNGHYNTPYIPKIEGADEFTGKILHSHDYREPKPFANLNVLVIGAGPSGMDLALEISSCAQQVILSHHNPDPIKTVFPANVTMASDVIKFTKDGAIFKDNTIAMIDIVFYCTGYCYNFPFLNQECGIKIENNFVEPLYKHLINVNYPTMCFIGLPFYVCAFSLFDLQSRFFLKVLDGSLILPTKDKMLEDLAEEKDNRKKAGLGPRQGHMMGHMQGEYYKELAIIADIEPLPPVLAKLHNESSQRFLDDLCNYRNDVYKIIDDNTYEQIV